MALAAWVSYFPSLVVGGEFDEVVERFSADAEDPNYRCACLSHKAWMLRAAGRWDDAVAMWVENAKFMDESFTETITDPDTFGQVARNYAAFFGIEAELGAG